MNALAAAMGVLSPAGNRARLSILIFHRVLPAPDPLFPDEPDARRFDELLTWIRSWMCVVPLDDAVRRLAEGTLPARAAAITFDDGYADNLSVALPILLHHGVTATFFIATEYLDGGCMWNDRIIAAIRQCASPTLDLAGLGLGQHALTSLLERRYAIDRMIGRAKYLDTGERERVAAGILEAARVAAPAEIMMTSSDICTLRASGMQIGGHTVSHPILARLPVDEARREVNAGKNFLERLLQEPIELFAYPNGKPGVDYLAEHTRIAREAGFLAAVSTGWGAADRATDLMQLPRFTPWDRTHGKFGMRLVANLLRRPSNVRGIPFAPAGSDIRKEPLHA